MIYIVDAREKSMYNNKKMTIDNAISRLENVSRDCVSHASSGALEKTCDVAVILGHVPTIADLEGKKAKRALVVTGTRDGKAKPILFAARRFEARTQFPDVSFFFLRGASHGSFLDDEKLDLDYDLKPLVSHSETHDHLARLFHAFSTGDKDELARFEIDTTKLADPLVKALELEGSEALGGTWCNSDYPTNPQCNYPKYPDFSLPGGPSPAPEPPTPADCICVRIFFCFTLCINHVCSNS